MREEMRAQFSHYLEHQDSYVKEYDGKAIVLKEFDVIGTYDTEFEAVEGMMDNGHALGTFLVQQVTSGDRAYTVNIATPNLINNAPKRSLWAETAEQVLEEHAKLWETLAEL